MNRILLATAAALALATSSIHEAHAQASFYCVNCVSPAFQLPQWLQDFENQTQMIQQQIQMVQYQLNFWQTLIQNTIDLPVRIFNDITGEINQLEGIARQAEMIGQHTVFMINHLNDPSGFGGNLNDIPLALAQENNALANAMQIMGVAIHSSQDMQLVYSTQINTLQAQVPSGMTQAVQIGNQIEATRAQQLSIAMNTEAVSMQALATAELRKAHRETLLDTRALQDQYAAVAAQCGYLTAIRPPVCGGGGGGATGPSTFLIPGTTTPITGAAGGTGTTAAATSAQSVPIITSSTPSEPVVNNNLSGDLGTGNTP